MFRLVHRRAIVAVAAIVWGTQRPVGARDRRDDRPSQDAQETRTVELLHTARAIVRQGQSAGVVVRLDRPGRPAGSGPLFDLDEGAARVPPLPGLTGAPRELLRRHLARNTRLELFDN